MGADGTGEPVVVTRLEGRQVVALSLGFVFFVNGRGSENPTFCGHGMAVDFPISFQDLARCSPGSVRFWAGNILFASRSLEGPPWNSSKSRRHWVSTLHFHLRWFWCEDQSTLVLEWTESRNIQKLFAEKLPNRFWPSKKRVPSNVQVTLESDKWRGSQHPRLLWEVESPATAKVRRVELHLECDVLHGQRCSALSRKLPKLNQKKGL